MRKSYLELLNEFTTRLEEHHAHGGCLKEIVVEECMFFNMIAELEPHLPINATFKEFDLMLPYGTLKVKKEPKKCKLIAKVYETKKKAQKAMTEDSLTMSYLNTPHEFKTQEMSLDLEHTRVTYFNMDNIEEMGGGVFDVVIVVEEMSDDMYGSVLAPLEAAGATVKRYVREKK